MQEMIPACDTSGEGGAMFLVNTTVQDKGKECLDVKMYEMLTKDEGSLISHTRIFRDDSGQLAERILFRREHQLKG